MQTSIVYRTEGGIGAALSATGLRGPSDRMLCGCGEKKAFGVFEHSDGYPRVVATCWAGRCSEEDLRNFYRNLVGSSELDDPNWRPTNGATRNTRRMRSGAEKRTTGPTVRNGHKTREKAKSSVDEEKIAAARSLWELGEDATGSPALRYLLNRKAWRWKTAPKAIRWVPASVYPPMKTHVPMLPANAAGALLWRYERPNDPNLVVAVKVEAITGEADRIADGSRTWRKNSGVITKAGFSPKRIGEGPVVIVEGEADALAVASVLGAKAEVWSGSGTSGFSALAVAFERNRPVLLLLDSDLAGERALAKATVAIFRARRQFAVERGLEPDPAAAIRRDRQGARKTLFAALERLARSNREERPASEPDEHEDARYDDLRIYRSEPTGASEPVPLVDRWLAEAEAEPEIGF